jgi:hypothetical protein
MMPREAHAREHVGRERALPGNREGALNLENAGIVNENFDAARRRPRRLPGAGTS